MNERMPAGLASPRDLLQIAQHAVIHLGPAEMTLQAEHLRRAIAAVDQSQNSLVRHSASHLYLIASRLLPLPHPAVLPG